jgi:microcystin-dependent protein
MSIENFHTASNILTEGVEIDLSAAFLSGDQYLTGGLVYSESGNKFSTSVDNIPVGIVRMWAKGEVDSAPPSDYLICDGSSILVADYPKLHSIIQYRFGGSGLNFNLPRLNVKTSETYRIPSGIDREAVESDQLNNVSTISIGSSENISHSHNITTFSYNSTSGNSANQTHSHSNSNTATSSHAHNHGNITSNASHSHNFGSANANHSHTYFDGGSSNAATGNPNSNHAHDPVGVLENHSHSSSTVTHDHTFGDPTFNSTSSHSHSLTANFSSESTSHEHDLSSTGFYFIIKYR